MHAGVIANVDGHHMVHLKNRKLITVAKFINKSRQQRGVLFILPPGVIRRFGLKLISDLSMRIR
jgi:hypothetical protein